MIEKKPVPYDEKGDNTGIIIKKPEILAELDGYFMDLLAYTNGLEEQVLNGSSISPSVLGYNVGRQMASIKNIMKLLRISIDIKIKEPAAE